MSDSIVGDGAADYNGATENPPMLPRLLAALLAAGCVSRGVISADDPQPPNIVLIVADDLGYGDLGCYGQRRIQTPNIDRLAREGLRFTDFYAGSTVCAPSRCVLMTGYHTGHCSIRGNSKQNLQPEEVTVAEVLQQAGYASGLFGKWGLGHEGSSGVPTRQGFDAFFGYLDQHHAHNYYPAFLMKGEERFPLDNVVPGPGDFGGGVAMKKVQYSHDLIAAEARKWVQSQGKRPFFLYLAFTTPHANNEAGKQGMEVPDYGPYADQDWPASQKGHAAMITRMDADIGRLVALLHDMRVGDNTLVLFSSDNGPHAEGGNDPKFQQSSGTLRGIKRDLTEGGIRVPLIAHWPGRIAAGTTSSHVGYFADVMPTLAEVAGRTDLVPKDVDGLSLVPSLAGQPSRQKTHDSLYWAFYERGCGQAVRMKNWKAVQQPINSAVRLYDLEADVGEEHNVAEAHPEVVAEAEQAMRAAYRPSEKWKFPALQGE